MAGLVDTIKSWIPGDAANKVPAAMKEANGHVTSGLDQSMRDQADKLHPVGKPMPSATEDNSFGNLK